MSAAALADAVLVLHAAVVSFVVLGQGAVMLGGPLGWRWVRALAFRASHLALMAYVAVQSWLGVDCPLTVWERTLRRAAGGGTYEVSFVEHWLSRLIFFQAPWWVFVAAYTAFTALVAASWWWWPPQRRGC